MRPSGTAELPYRGQIDLFLAYSPYTDKVYRVPVDEVGLREVWLRVDPLKPGAPRSTIRWATDYELRGSDEPGEVPFPPLRSSPTGNRTPFPRAKTPDLNP